MTTHAETIQVPDDLTIEGVSLISRTEAGGFMSIAFKPLPPPEPPILPCPFCGGAVAVNGTGDGKGFCLYHDLRKRPCPVVYHDTYPTRLAAIQAANRRAR